MEEENIARGIKRYQGLFVWCKEDLMVEHRDQRELDGT